MPGDNALVDFGDSALRVADLFRNEPQDLASDLRRLVARVGFNLGDQALQASDAKPLDNTKLGKMGPEGVRQHRALPNEKIARPMQNQNALPFGALYGHEAH